MRHLYFLLCVLLLAACNNEETEPLAVTSENTSPNEQTEEDIQNTEEVASEAAQNEETDDPAVQLLEEALPVPTTFDEIITHPVGPLSGNGYYSRLDNTNTLTDEQLVEAILSIIPELTEEELKDPLYLDKWFNALYTLFAEDYRDPQEILDAYSFEAFGKLLINGKPVQFQDQLNVLLILDASGSMENELNGQSMMQTALEEINSLIDRLPDNINIGLRIYGGKNAELNKSCSDIELLEPIDANNKDNIKAALNNISAKGSTPLAASLQQALEDFVNFPSETNSNFIYLISDGLENCGGDPVAEAEKLVASNIAPIVNVIGFNVDPKGQTQLENIAQSGNGQYIHALNKQSFADSLSSIEKVVDAWTKRKLEIQDDALDYRGKISNALYELNREWDDHVEDEYRVFMSVMDELNSRDPNLYGDVQDVLLKKISAKNNVYRNELTSKYDKLINELDTWYESIVNSLK